MKTNRTMRTANETKAVGLLLSFDDGFFGGQFNGGNAAESDAFRLGAFCGANGYPQALAVTTSECAFVVSFKGRAEFSYFMVDGPKVAEINPATGLPV